MSTEKDTPSEPSSELLEQWFKDYGCLFRVEVLDQWYLFRYLTRREFRLLMFMNDEIDRADELCQTVVLWPPNFKVLPTDKAGPAEAISKEVLRVSGFGEDMKQRFDFYEKEITDNIEPQMEAIVEYVFGDSGGNFDKYQDWSQERLFDTYQRAMWILRVVEAKQHLIPVAKDEKTLTPADVLKKLRKEAHEEGKDPNAVNMAEAMENYKRHKREVALRSKMPGQAEAPAMRTPSYGAPKG